MRICGAWVKRCDGLYFIAPSAGANWERQSAQELGKPIFESLAEVPKIDLEAKFI